ncbi:MAG TPA: ThuA domain-containing protein [Candidatus Saccharimonadales bacterium]|nr:ThuA domain-containing protein [Candidatus Saccharimonadales bacterium]
MKRPFRVFAVLLTLAVPAVVHAQSPRFRAVAFYSTDTETDHVLFAEDAVKFFGALAQKNNFVFDSTTDWHNLNENYLKNYQVVLWLNGSPSDPEQRRAFQKYMDSGGAWLGFHGAGYNDKDTGWPWYVDFLGGAVFYTNSWPPLPGKLLVDAGSHPAVASVPSFYLSPQNEWYIWKPDPRLSKDVQVLLTLDPSEYPLGFKDILTSGDLPVVWSNTRYRMIYMNMGHGDKIFASESQNKLFENAILWLGGKTPVPSTTPTTAKNKGPASGLRVSFDAVAVNPKTNKAYAVHPEANAVTVVDTRSRKASSIKVGVEPLAISINPQTNRIYVANSGDGTVSIIDGATDTVTSTIDVGTLPTVIAVNPANNNVYIARTFSNSMPVIDGASNSVTTLQPGFQADAIAVNAAANQLYMLNYESKNITVLDGSNNAISRIPTAAHLWGIGLNPATGKVYAGNTGGPMLTIAGGDQHGSSEATVGQIPCAIAVDSNAGRIYVANYAGNSVSVLDAATNAVLGTMETAAHPQAIAVNPATRSVFAVSTRANTVTVIDGSANKVVANVTVNGGPYAIAIDSANNQIFVESIVGHQLTRIDAKTLAASAVVASKP